MRRAAAFALLLLLPSCAGVEPRGEGYVETALPQQLVFVAGGTFERGNAFEGGDEDERPVQPVKLSDFYLGKTEVTQAQWQSVMGANASEVKDPAAPVTNVSWFDVQEFLEKLRKKTGKSYRLPSEAEWEYAARSGGRAEQWAGTSDPGALGDYAWFADTSEGKPHPVGQKKPNGLGLHDLTGNVLEWTADWYGSYPGRPSADPSGPEAGKRRVVRDGSFASSAAGARAALRDSYTPDYRSPELGFRLARSAQ